MPESPPSSGLEYKRLSFIKANCNFTQPAARFILWTRPKMKVGQCWRQPACGSAHPSEDAVDRRVREIAETREAEERARQAPDVATASTAACSEQFEGLARLG
jgi:hypothetical protein